VGVQRKKVKILGQKLWLSSIKQTKHQKVIIMKSYQDVQAAYINRTTLLANLYHTNAIKLIDLVLTHNKNAMEASNQRASDILNSKDLPGISKLIAKDVANQIKEYTSFANSAYLLGSQAHATLIEACQSHAKDHAKLATHTLHSISESDNPITAMAISIAQAALDASTSAITSAKASSKA